MNVLLAEANVPYDLLCEPEQINNDFPNTDVVIVAGANDVVNPAARYKKDSPLFGMPILNADKARTCHLKAQPQARFCRGGQRTVLRSKDHDGFR